MIFSNFSSVFGSVARLALRSDDRSISVSSLLKLFMAASLITLVRTYFCYFVVCSEMPRLTVHGRWSDMLPNIMEDERTHAFYEEFKKKIWSMRLHECLANLVGKLILEKKLFVHIKSRKSPNFSRSEICNRFILKSPTIAAYVFSRWIITIIGESSDINCCIFALLLLSWGGRYMLPIVNVRQRSPPLMSINKPSQMLELVNKFHIL